MIDNKLVCKVFVVKFVVSLTLLFLIWFLEL